MVISMAKKIHHNTDDPDSVQCWSVAKLSYHHFFPNLIRLNIHMLCLYYYSIQQGSVVFFTKNTKCVMLYENINQISKTCVSPLWQHKSDKQDMRLSFRFGSSIWVTIHFRCNISLYSDVSLKLNFIIQHMSGLE